jgi:cell fate regulator YaaT (PSP1 superfamily)
MADIPLHPVGPHTGTGEPLRQNGAPEFPAPPASLDEARARARDRFKERLQNGEKIGGCDCHSEDQQAAPRPNEPAAQVVGVRFRDSGRTYYFDANGHELSTGSWVVVETGRGHEAGRVIIAPHQIRLNQLQGDLKPVLRRLSDDDIAHMDSLKRESATAVKAFGRAIREHGLPMKPISAEYSFDGSHLTLNYSSQDRVEPRSLAVELANHFNCRVELKQVGPRDEARLLGGMGRCGRTLCCSSWLPVFPEISMGMAKTQDLSLNPTKVSGVCGRLLCCLSYENEQYKQMKAVLPRLGQTIETPQGPGLVVSLQVLKELVTVRLASAGANQEMVFSSADLGFGATPAPVPAQAPIPAERPVDVPVKAVASDDGTHFDDSAEMASTTDHRSGDDDSGETRDSGTQPQSSRRRRRRRRGPGNRPADGGGTP